MRWSLKLGTFGGIAVYLHGTFLLLVAWIVFANLATGYAVGEILSELLFLALVFTCVVLHEFGHALTARHFGIPTRDITLYPIGGVARLQRLPREPRQELLVALAGPAVNGVIAGALFVALAATHRLVAPDPFALVGGHIPAKLMWVNAAIGTFNLVPAFPMDGGRVLRALLAARMSYARATLLAAQVGQALAFGFGLFGLLHNPLLLFIAFFVYVGAGEEATQVHTEAAFHGIPVREAMVTEFSWLEAEAPLSEAAHRLIAGTQHDFPVLRNTQLVGVLTREALIGGLAELGPEGTVAEIMEPAQSGIDPEESLEAAYRTLQEGGMRTLPIFQGEQLVGLLTRENLGEFLLVSEAVQRARSHAGSVPG